MYCIRNAPARNFLKIALFALAPTSYSPFPTTLDQSPFESDELPLDLNLMSNEEGFIHLTQDEYRNFNHVKVSLNELTLSD
jgi:hypothetical protein